MMNVLGELEAQWVGVNWEKSLSDDGEFKSGR